jgi:hypothetical protein
LRYGKGFLPRYRTVFLQVGLVSHDNDRDILIVLYPDNLLPEFGEFIEAAVAGDREDEEESLTCLHVQFSEDLLAHNSWLERLERRVATS